MRRSWAAVEAPAFRAARHLKKILGGGFEMIRISQCESPRVFLGLLAVSGGMPPVDRGPVN